MKVNPMNGTVWWIKGSKEGSAIWQFSWDKVVTWMNFIESRHQHGSILLQYGFMKRWSIILCQQCWCWRVTRLGRRRL